MNSSNYQRGILYKGNIVKIVDGKKVIYKENALLGYKDDTFSDIDETIIPSLSMLEYQGKGDTEGVNREHEKISHFTYPILPDDMVGKEGVIYADESTIRETFPDQKKNTGEKKRG